MRPAAARHVRVSARPAAENLEPRTLLTTFVVTDAADAGPGTLRQAILDANLLTGADTITFSIPGDDAVRTIRPLSPLPNVTGTTTIDGTTQAGVVVQLDGSLAGASANGLTLYNDQATPAGQPNQSIVRGLVINRFSGHGVAVGAPVAAPTRPGPGPTGVRIEGNLIGTDWTGNVALGNGGAGIYDNANSTFIGFSNTPTAVGARNVISGNAGPGVWVVGTKTNTQGSGIHGNYIGTSATGSRALGNGREGVLVEGSGLLDIGGNTAATRNVISGNASSGIRVAQTGGQVNVRNSYVGTNAAGTAAVPNGWSPLLPYHDGITVQSIGAVFIVGGPTLVAQAPLRNVISGNAGAGVRVEMSQDAQVVGNYIGTDATGFADVGNGGAGVVGAWTGTSSLRTANFGRLTGNLISGNDGDGVYLGPGSGVSTQFGGNYIGTNAAGTGALGNRGNGVTVDRANIIQSLGNQGPVPAPLPGNLINPTSTTRNVISANGGHGVAVLAGTTTGPSPALRTIVNNYIGTDYTGTLPLGNGGSGIYTDVQRMMIGVAAPPSTGGGNVISANGGNGITIVAAPLAQGSVGPTNNQIQGNRIGVAAATTPTTNPFDPGANTGLGNHGHGIAIYHSVGNRIGTGQAGGANIIAYNDGNGVLVEGSGAGTLTSPNGTTAATLISGNGIYANGKLGIDLSPGFEGVTANDPRDTDVGPNGLLNYPTITEAALNTAGTSVQIRFMLAAAPGAGYRVEFFASPLPDPSGYGEGRTFLGTVPVTVDSNGAGQGSFTVPNLPAGSLYFTATTVSSTGNVTSEFSPAVKGVVAVTPRPQASTTVSERRVFYKDSAFDGDAAAGATRYLAAVATDKRALLPGGLPSFANLTSYTKGINGIELMFFNPSLLQLGLTPDDIGVRVGKGGDPSGWVAGPAPAAVEIVPIPGPNTMYALTWADGALLNTWVEVTVKANAHTGLLQPDVFYFGNLVGETGDASAMFAVVNALDLAGVRSALGSAATATSRYDFNRDGTVNALDLAAARAAYGHTLGAPAPVPVPAPPGDEAGDDMADSITRQVLE